MGDMSAKRQLLLLAAVCFAAFYLLLAHVSSGTKPSKIIPASQPLFSSSYSGQLSFGVNVYGWIRGDFGGGRSARAVINNLHAARVNVTAVEISGADLHSATNMAIEEQGFALLPEKTFAFDLFVINAANTISTLMDPHNEIHQEHYRIGLWHWETSKLPLVQGAHGKYYNEIWVPTQFVADAILATASFPKTAVKVVVLPYGYETLPSPVGSSAAADKRLHRQQLPDILRRISWQSRDGVLKSVHAEQTLQHWATAVDGQDVTLFLVIFDFNSDYNRKNIVATVKAFLKAFPSHNGGRAEGSTSGLIIKSINAHKQIDDYNRLHWLLDGGNVEGISYDERVVFFDGLCSEIDLEQLKLAVDCYVSLHRAEGLGLNIMEAVLAGVPVIASAYSGSEQFMAPLYSEFAPELRIPSKTVQVNREFGPYTADMQWGEPSEGAAVNAMRLVYSYPAHYAALAAGPIRTRAMAMLSPESTGLAMKARLQLLHDCMNLVLSSGASEGEVSENANICLTRVLGRRKKISEKDAIGLYNLSLSAEIEIAARVTSSTVKAVSLPVMMDFDEEEEEEEEAV